jgi:FMN-dependent NADH-azoreductase
MTNILRIDSSARHSGSASRELGTRLIERLGPDTNLKAQLSIADEFIAELVDADAVVIGLPIYNFGPPAAMKAWADLVARAGSTFRYTATGPEGLIPNKPVYVIVASGGVPVGSPMDLASTWLATFLGFLGLTDVTVIAADQLNVDPDGALAAARARVDQAVLASV